MEYGGITVPGLDGLIVPIAPPCSVYQSALLVDVICAGWAFVPLIVGVGYSVIVASESRQRDSRDSTWNLLACRLLARPRRSFMLRESS